MSAMEPGSPEVMITDEELSSIFEALRAHRQQSLRTAGGMALNRSSIQRPESYHDGTDAPRYIGPQATPRGTNILEDAHY